MIRKYLFELDETSPLHPSRAYAFYGCLMSLLSADTVEWLHEQGETPISQYLYYDKAAGKNYWTVILLGSAICEVLAPVLDSLNLLPLHSGKIEMTLKEICKYDTPEELILSAKEHPLTSIVEINSYSPISFKQNKRYVILPQEKLIIQSLIKKWDTVFPEYPLNDEDVIDSMLNGVHIVDYSLHSVRYPLKGIKIPSFSGKLILEAHLPQPLFEIWKILIFFARFSGIGIKTSLGMGGVKASCVCEREHTSLK